MQDINFLFNDVSLYTKEIFNIFKENSDNTYSIDEKEIERFNNYIGIGSNKLITYCHKCKKEFPFDIERKYYEFSRDINYTNYITLTQSFNIGPKICRCKINLDTGRIIDNQHSFDKDCILNNTIGYIEYIFSCTNNEEHKYILLISIELHDFKLIVRKVGQNPSMLTVKGFDFDKYKKVLEEIGAYEDYKKADLSNADHFYVGAYAYLRRIFEKLIEYYLNGKKLKDNHMNTKIDAVKSNFDPRVKSLLENLYSILSVGIHELDENISMKYYQYLKAIIDMQLEFMTTEREKKEQSTKLEKTINEIKNMIKQ